MLIYFYTGNSICFHKWVNATNSQLNKSQTEIVFCSCLFCHCKGCQTFCLQRVVLNSVMNILIWIYVFLNVEVLRLQLSHQGVGGWVLTPEWLEIFPERVRYDPHQASMEVSGCSLRVLLGQKPIKIWARCEKNKSNRICLGAMLSHVGANEGHEGAKISRQKFGNFRRERLYQNNHQTGPQMAQ